MDFPRRAINKGWRDSDASQSDEDDAPPATAANLDGPSGTVVGCDEDSSVTDHQADKVAPSPVAAKDDGLVIEVARRRKMTRESVRRRRRRRPRALSLGPLFSVAISEVPFRLIRDRKAGVSTTKNVHPARRRSVLAETEHVLPSPSIGRPIATLPSPL